MTPRYDDREVLRDGELTVIGRIRSASNATFLCEATLGDRAVHCVYKPVAGEAPLWDFPDGTLAGRELGAYLVSTQLGWNLVPYTVIRDGPAGPGMLQLWVRQPGDAVGEVSEAGESGAEQPHPGPDLVDLFPVGASPPGYLPVLRAYDYAGDEVVLMHADDPRLRRMAVFDVLVNNADRKGGHILCGVDGRVYGVDHGCACTWRTSCGRCCGAGPASQSTTTPWPPSPAWPRRSPARSATNWPSRSPGRRSPRCACARTRCWTIR